MTDLDPAARTAAFELLREIVRDWSRDGRRTYGASLKPELRRRTLDSFHESKLGFESFKQFLLAAEREGHVEVHPAPSGPDIQAVVPGEALEDRPQERPRSRDEHDSGRVREDIWKAWVDWDPNLTRYYDLVEERAYRLPRRVSALDSPEVKRVREDREGSPKRFIEIAPISFEEQTAWMRDFATAQPSDVRFSLLSALDSDRPARDFTAYLLERPELLAAWRKERLRRVVERIRAFQESTGLRFQLFARSRSSRPKSDHSSETDRGNRLSLDEGELRARLRAAVDAMPISELLSLKVPLEYLVNVRR